MSDLGQARRSTLLDAAWRTAYRVGFPLARIWWRLRHQQHEGALVAVYVGQALLLVRSSYRIEWNFPGGTVRQGETPEEAARRELAEEIGLAGAFSLVAVGDAWGLWDGRRDKVHFFGLRLDRLPELQLDNREIIGARLISPSELRGMALTGPVAVYLGRNVAQENGGSSSVSCLLATLEPGKAYPDPAAALSTTFNCRPMRCIALGILLRS